MHAKTWPGILSSHGSCGKILPSLWIKKEMVSTYRINSAGLYSWCKSNAKVWCHYSFKNAFKRTYLFCTQQGSFCHSIEHLKLKAQCSSNHIPNKSTILKAMWKPSASCQPPQPVLAWLRLFLPWLKFCFHTHGLQKAKGTWGYAFTTSITLSMTLKHTMRMRACFSPQCDALEESWPILEAKMGIYIYDPPLKQVPSCKHDTARWISMHKSCKRVCVNVRFNVACWPSGLKLGSLMSSELLLKVS